jgi:NTE family protein
MIRPADVLKALGSSVLVAVCAASAAAAAEPEPPQELRVGLVLSGGGAKGAAHVGVLQVLEELRVPVHCVAGTSMGAVVGGLYAAGVPPSEMERLLEATDWTDLLDDRPPRRHLPFRRKVDDLRYLTRFEVGFRDGRFRLPTGLVTGQKLDFLLAKLTAHTAGLGSFDELPIPFRAVAADLESGEMVVLSDGDLATALRASMSVPGAFAPVRHDGRVLVDGGIVRNLPVDVVRAMGADVVIAVDVGMDTVPKERLSSLAGVLGQIIVTTLRENVRRQVRDADVVIRPDLHDYRSTDFDRIAAMVPRGVQAAGELAAVLAAYGVDQQRWQRYLEELRIDRTVEGAVTGVQLSMSETADPQRIVDEIQTRPGDPLDLEAIGRDLERLYRLGDYERVGFRLRPDEHGSTVVIEARDKPWGPNYLRFGLNLSSDFEGEGTFNVGAVLTLTGLNRLRGEGKVALQLGEDPAVFAELYQPLSRSAVPFIAPWLESTLDTKEAVFPDGRIGTYRYRVARGGVDLGLALGRFGELRAGVLWGTGNGDRHRGPGELPAELEFTWGGYRLLLQIDQLDDPNFPQEGYWGNARMYLSRSGLGADDAYDRLELDVGGAISAGPSTGVLWASGGTALGTRLPVYDQLELGGLFNLSGTAEHSVRGQYGGMVGVAWFRRVLAEDDGLVDLYVGGSLEAGGLWEQASRVSLDEADLAGSVFVGADTLLGPVYVAYGRTSAGQDAWYLYVGRFF